MWQPVSVANPRGSNDVSKVAVHSLQLLEPVSHALTLHAFVRRLLALQPAVNIAVGRIYGVHRPAATAAGAPVTSQID